MFEKMKKSLGNKRNVMTEAQIDHVTRLYAAFSDTGEAKDVVRIFNNQDFAYIKLTIERPLRLNFQLTPDRIARVKTAAAFIALAESKKRKDKAEIEAEVRAGQREQAAILDVLDALASKHSTTLYKDRAAFAPLIDAAFKKAEIKLATSLRKAIISALGERDETAEICREKDVKNGAPEPDADLRDTENMPYAREFPLPVPLKYGDKPDLTELLALVTDHCNAYFGREVRPHVRDAWIDYGKTKIGFEIPFNRHFYQYVPPRPLADIAADIRKLEGEIVTLLGEVAV